MARGTEDAHAGHRHERLETLLFEELESLLAGEVTDPALADVRVTKVELSVDYRSVRARFVTDASADPSKEELELLDRAFNRAGTFMRRRLQESLDLKRVPELHFIYDRDASAAARAALALAENPPKATE